MNTSINGNKETCKVDLRAALICYILVDFDISLVTYSYKIFMKFTIVEMNLVDRT